MTGIEWKELENKIQQSEHFYIYGAGVVAYGAYRAIEHLFGVKPTAFVVTKKTKEAETIEDIQIIELSAISEKTECFFLVATPEEYHEEIGKNLERYELLRYLLLDAELEYQLMGRYLKETYQYQLIEEKQCSVEKKETAQDVYVGMAVSIHDKPLREVYKEPAWVHKIQVGAKLTQERIAEETDACIDSISSQNEIYGELTATYAMWKNVDKDVIGLYHYRRVLAIQEKALQILIEGGADVILPLPFVCEPDTSGQFGRYLCEEDIQVMKTVLQKRNEKHWDKIQQVMQGECLYNYNILVAKKEVFQDYCNWIFPILQEITQICEKEPRERLSRYIGRVGEVLSAVYFLANWNNWEIVHAKKVWRV